MDLKSPITTTSPIHDAAELLKDTEYLLQYGTWIWTPHTGTMDWSHGMYRLMGYLPDGLSGFSMTTYLQHLPEIDREHFRQETEAAIENGSTFSFMHLLNNREGVQFLVLTKGKIIQENEETRVIGITQNIGEQQKLQEEMLHQRKMMDHYEVFLKFGTWQYASATNEIYWSVGMYSLFGYDAIRDRHMKIDETVYEKHIDPADYKKGVQLKANSVNKNDYFWQYRIIAKNGESKWLETYGHTVWDQNGRLVNTFGITRDITRLKLYEHSLQLKINELNRSNSELEEFAYIASHDMQEPLRKLITFGERLTSKFSDTLKDEGQLYINRMMAATSNMRLLIDNLLDFSRVARTEGSFESTDLNDMLQKTLADLEVSIEETKAVITAVNLPVIEAQSQQMKQLFLNILSNALKFRKRSVPPQINIACSQVPRHDAREMGLEKDTEYFKITISDNGLGFEQEYAQRIFQIFQRLHGKSEYPGSGIGLAICKKIVDYHNGVIFAQGRLDEGAIITIILPQKQ